MQQMKAAIDQLSHALEQAHQEHTQLEQAHQAGLQKQQMQNQTVIQKHAMEVQSKQATTAQDNATKVEVARINADASRDVAEIGGLIQQLLVHMQADPRFQAAADKPDEA
jgi:hypothetical protein